jgi:hypothetical protein
MSAMLEWLKLQCSNLWLRCHLLWHALPTEFYGNIIWWGGGGSYTDRKVISCPLFSVREESRLKNR